MKGAFTGKAYEYAIAKILSQVTGRGLRVDVALQGVKRRYDALDNETRHRMDISAREVARFLAAREGRMRDADVVYLNEDMAGRSGDVRDVVAKCKGGDVGISAKHNSDAVKHSRLSDKIDFGKKWGGCPVSERYWKAVRPIFASMRQAQKQGRLFVDIERKEQIYYLPILTAFQDELKRLCEEHGADFIRPFFKYIVGDHDFYKVICRADHSIIESYNLGDTLEWGSKWKVPRRIEKIERKRGSCNTLFVTFEGGWEMSFRLHNARKEVEPSLKFDIKFIGMSTRVARHEILHD